MCRCIVDTAVGAVVEARFMLWTEDILVHIRGTLCRPLMMVVMIFCLISSILA